MKKTTNFRVAVEAFLIDQGILPISENNNGWKYCMITHPNQKPSSDEIKEFRLYIEKEIPKQGGLYAYLNQNNKLLYIGKSKNIPTRVFSHFREAYLPYTEATRAACWYKFFHENTGELKLYWRLIEQDRLRRAIEEMVEEVNPSIFEKEYTRGNRNLKSNQ